MEPVVDLPISGGGARFSNPNIKKKYIFDELL